MLIIVNRNPADLNGTSGGSSIAILGGISAILVGTVFLVATYLYLRTVRPRRQMNEHDTPMGRKGTFSGLPLDGLG
jgi:hypothetical protein